MSECQQPDTRCGECTSLDYGNMGTLRRWSKSNLYWKLGALSTQNDDWAMSNSWDGWIARSRALNV
jgi:hypothetical protein